MTEPSPVRHPVWWYRVVVILLVVGVTYLLFSGRLAENFRGVQAPQPISDQAFDRILLSNFLWVVSILPFLATAHWLVTKRRAERSLGSYWGAAKTMVIVAARGAAPRTADVVDEIEPPEDDRWLALLKGVGIALVMPTFFWFSPVRIPHTPRVAAWLSVSGALMGSSVYCIERARPYVNPEWLARQSARFFGKTYTVDSANYNGPGKRWIAAYWVCAALMMISWLAGAAWAIGRQPR